ncbi:MAG: sigma-70 family RNA polymerase sigma factor [Candidatus Poribacteria bacterium]|nr:sigma-70 family RNA polymerase sigma factor [Candidatus Poribacteria bacterium]
MKNSDIQLIQRVLNGDDTAFSELVKKYQKQVHALAWRKIGDFHIAEEITQDTFLKAYQKLRTLKKPQRFASWLYVIATNRCNTWLHKKHFRAQLLKNKGGAQPQKPSYSEYAVEENERISMETQREVVKKLLAKLEESERTVMTLHYFAEMSCAEIGAFLGVSANTIKSRLRRAQQRLKKEEPMIREALENFQISPNLTETVMREVSRVKLDAPFSSKPLVPWAVAASTLAAVLLMLGFGNHQYLTRFQKPYSFDAASEMTVEIIDTPIVANLESKIDVRTQIGRTNAVGKRHTPEQQPNDAPATVAEAQTEETVKDWTQWELPEKAKARFGKGMLSDCVYLPDGNRLAVLSSIGTWIYDVPTGEALDLITDPFTEDMFLSPDGETLAVGSDGSVYLWDLQTKKLRNVLVGDANRIGALAFSPTGETVAGATWNNAIQLWDRHTGKLLKTFIGHTDINTLSMSLHFIAYSDDGKRLASVGWRDKTIRIWDVDTGQRLQTITALPEHIYSIAYSPDSQSLVGSGSDSNIYLWDVGTGERLKTLTGHTSGVGSVTYSRDGTTLVSGSWDKTIRFWDASTGKLLKTLTGHTDSVNTVMYAPDGKTVVSMSYFDGTIRFWDVGTAKLLKTITGHTGSFGRSIAFSPDGEMLAYNGMPDHTISLRDVQSGQLLRILTGHTDIVNSVRFSPDSSVLASGGWDGNIRLWDVATGQLEKTITGHEKGVPSIVYSSDGAIFMSGSWDNTIRIWDVDTDKPLKTITANVTELENEGVNAMSLSPDGGTIASATDEKVIRLWDVHTGQLKDSLVGHTNRVAAVAFSPRGTVLASGSDDATLRLWDVETGKLLNTFKEPTKSSVLSVAFSPDGRILASGCYAVIRLRDTFTERSTVTLTGHTTWVRALAFSPDGHILASISEDGVVMLWDMSQVSWQ